MPDTSQSCHPGLRALSRQRNHHPISLSVHGHHAQPSRPTRSEEATSPSLRPQFRLPARPHHTHPKSNHPARSPSVGAMHSRPHPPHLAASLAALAASRIKLPQAALGRTLRHRMPPPSGPPQARAHFISTSHTSHKHTQTCSSSEPRSVLGRCLFSDERLGALSWLGGRLGLALTEGGGARRVEHVINTLREDEQHEGGDDAQDAEEGDGRDDVAL